MNTGHQIHNDARQVGFPDILPILQAQCAIDPSSHSASHTPCLLPSHCTGLTLTVKTQVIHDHLFLHENGSPVTRNTLTTFLKTCIRFCNLDPACYNTYSFRIGRATQLALDNTPLDTIKSVGWYQSSAYAQYVRPSYILLPNWIRGHVSFCWCPSTRRRTRQLLLVPSPSSGWCSLLGSMSASFGSQGHYVPPTCIDSLLAFSSLVFLHTFMYINLVVLLIHLLTIHFYTTYTHNCKFYPYYNLYSYQNTTCIYI